MHSIHSKAREVSGQQHQGKQNRNTTSFDLHPESDTSSIIQHSERYKKEEGVSDDVAIAKHLRLNHIVHAAYKHFTECIADGEIRWWTDVVITAKSAQQAHSYEDEIRFRGEQERLPVNVNWLVVPDLGDARIGSGGATLHALRTLASRCGSIDWSERRVLMIHAGGDSRRLPQYSPSGKLFSPLPVLSPFGDASTVFDELLALSTLWASRMKSGLLVSCGDVVVTFDPAAVLWDRPGISGIAVLETPEVGSNHGVYVVDAGGRVRSFLQKPSSASVEVAGGAQADGRVAVDTGLLLFDSNTASRLVEIACANEFLPTLDLYEHFTKILTGQWQPSPEAPAMLHALIRAFAECPFWCSAVEGEFTHIGTTRAFRDVIAEAERRTYLRVTQPRLGSIAPDGVDSSGVIVDSIFKANGKLASEAVAIDCEFEAPIDLGRGAIAQGVAGLKVPLQIPPGVVVHQIPVRLADGSSAFVVRVYGVDDNPKKAEWFGRPIEHVLRDLGINNETAWPDVPQCDRTLWNAALFAASTLEEAWTCARWVLGLPADYSAERWCAARRVSLSESADLVNSQSVSNARTRRMHTQWQLAGQALACSGADVRPMLAHSPGIASLTLAGRAIAMRAKTLEHDEPTTAASQHYIAGLFLQQAGLVDEARQAQTAAFECVQTAVDRGTNRKLFPIDVREWRHEAVTVSAPARIDLGGGWSDTPPFCLDWGGSVLNIAVELNGKYPIRTAIRRLKKPWICCVCNAEHAEFSTQEELFRVAAPGSLFAISQAALQQMLTLNAGESLEVALARRGGGLEIRTAVDLPIGSGLGTSSILAATVLRALAEMMGISLSEQNLLDQVMLLEQKITTGGGWQDAMGGIYPGAKIAVSRPGNRQQLRIEPVNCRSGFTERLVLYYTGIQRSAKDLVRQVVGRYLARENKAIEVLHHIKTLALEMAWALREGEWEYLGNLLDRHWELNQMLDPHTTNERIDLLLRKLRPYIAGAKLAGAGGGGFLILLAKSPADAVALRAELRGDRGALYEFEIALESMQVDYDHFRKL